MCEYKLYWYFDVFPMILITFKWDEANSDHFLFELCQPVQVNVRMRQSDFSIPVRALYG